MTQSEIKNNIIGAMNEPKAPEELVEKGLAMARAFTNRMEAKQSQNKEKEKEKDLTNEIPSIKGPSGGGLSM